MRHEKSIRGMNKILIRSPNWVGDALLITPAVHRLRTYFPKANITVLAKPWVTPVFEASPDVDQVILYKKPGIHQGMGGKWRLAQELKTSRFDVAVHFPHSFESVWISFLSRIPFRIGYTTEGRGLLLSDRLRSTPVREKEHQVPFFFHLLEPLGIREDPSAEKNPLCLNVDQQSLRQAEARLHALGIGPSDFLVGLAPGAVYGSAKCCPFDRFEQLAERLKKEWQAEVIFLGTDDDTLAGLFKESINGHHLLGKTTLGEALALIQRCRVMICNDSGLMHAASALNIPLVALFGSTDLHRTGPWGGISRVIKKDFVCSPCLKKVCPKTPTCMEAITVDEVWETLVSLQGKGIL
ncbi:MAG: lipopolysaccharide heptosyltransferase II [Deltaproteobacteria bacterium]|nr:lipopolysaccharide heptosyltransferase II [Deltaproteobacteria bacterium]